MTEVYSKSVDFPNGLTAGQLASEINEDSSITTTLLRIDGDGDVVIIIFQSTISAPEKTALDAVVAAHVVGPVPILLNDSDETLTMKQFLLGINCINPTADRTLTLMTAADTVNAISNARVGQILDYCLVNMAPFDYKITIAAGTGGTLTGNSDVYPQTNSIDTYHISGSSQFKLRFTNVTASSEAYTVYRIS